VLLAAALVGLVTLTAGAPDCNDPLLTAREEHGRELYQRMCAVCHGERGEGYKADQAPAIAHPAFLASATDELMRVAITDGRRGTTMSAWATVRGGPLSRDDVTAVIAYIHALGPHARAKLDERVPTGDVARGAAIYKGTCAGCHGERGIEGPNVHIGDAALLYTVSNGFLRHAIRDGREGTAMAGFARALGDGGVEDVVALLRSWQAGAPPAGAPPNVRPPPLPLGPVPLNPKGPEPLGFTSQPGTTKAAIIKAQLDLGARMALLDARAPSDYSMEHIAGAVSVPFYDPSPYLNALPKDAWLVCYCACPHAESKTLAAKLAAAGFGKVTVLDEGLGVWKARKYGTHTGALP